MSPERARARVRSRHTRDARRVLIVLAVFAAMWAVLVWLTGGFAFRSGWIRVSSQQPVDPAMAALACAAVVATIDWREGRTATATALIASVAGIGIVLVIWQWAQARPLWLDEEMIALNFRDRTASSLSGRLWLDQSAPLGWLMAERFVYRALGSRELAVRLLPAFFGIATLVAAAWIGRSWMTPIGAVAFVLLCSFGQWFSYYSVELKHYSADTFASLLLPALTVRVGAAESGAEMKKRLAAWGAAAVFGQWFSLGALLVVPACGAVLAWTVVRRIGVRGVYWLSFAGVFVIASFLAHDRLALRYARESHFFQEFWAFAFPPTSAGLVQRVSWFGEQLQPFAMKPGGTGLWLSLWLTAALGFAVARKRALAVTAASIVLSGFILAAVRLIPFYERLSLWFLTAIYLGVALFADSAVMLTGTALRWRWLRWSAAAVVGAVAFQLCSDIVRRGVDDVRTTRPPGQNRYLDDRSAVSHLMTQRRDGDVVITTRFGLPALWWYGSVPMTGDGSRLMEGNLLYVAEHVSGDCSDRLLWEPLRGQSRALLYFGFQDYPPWLDDVVLRDLSRLGAATEVRHFGSSSRFAIVDFRVPPDERAASWRDADATPAPPPGCTMLRAASRW